ncbi:lytic transglycosylase domain-containing protein [Corallococcus terminator]|uniref:Lytic transglycosylase domain-containing protein n=1 Tax=Corallococcus terminator TaxID=2316733 RepID=A0A3A8HU11_9BACT|nr:lytic transglycosylase domain-containing protein [Corallococcus terminator]RKG71034.1 lytic transglycosylase domain-containing protein [Corallococcus terminator]
MPSLLLFLLLASAPASDFSAPTPFEAEIQAAVVAVRGTFAVPPELIKAVIRQESAFNPRALSAVGAIGLMQIMPFNAARLGFTVEELWKPARNILAGARLLAVLLRHYEGDLISTLVAYNARPRPQGAALPDNGETPAYVAAVLKNLASYKAVAPRPGPISGPQTSAGAQKAPATMIRHFRSGER